MPYWIQSTLAATPALAWMFLGLGLPWALVVLPRRDWRDWPTVACLTLAFGPALLTAWMFILGSIQGQPLLRLDWILAGTAVIALIGWMLTWRKRNTASIGTRSIVPLHFDEKLLLAMIGIALIIRWLGVAYWPSTAYDALWVYAYEGKLYTLLGYIPNAIGYYPQFLPLQHTFLQLAVGGVDDHAARAVLPWLQLGSIFAAYVLGSRLFNRRVGIYVAAIWALYPHVGEWSRFGDLEIPIAFLFTTAAAFFLMAWRSDQPSAEPAVVAHSHQQAGDPCSLSDSEQAYRRRYAIIAGLLLGIGMWTKPTMGAFIWGVVLLAALEIIRQFITPPRNGTIRTRRALSLQTTLRNAWPRLQVAFWTGLASVPLGAVWYIRNFLTGHPPIDFPPGYWQTLAARSGVEFGWPLLALLVLLAWVWFGQKPSADSRQPSADQDAITNANPLKKRWILIGLALVLAGLMPSIYNSGRLGITDDRMSILEWLALSAGAALLFVTLWQWAQGRWTDEARRNVAIIGWGLALALPYFITWFYSYSYHYRLSFAIVPLMILPTAVILARWTEKIEPPRRREHEEESRTNNASSFHRGEALPRPGFSVGARRGLALALASSGLLIAIILLAVPGIIAPLYDPNAGWDWLWTDKLPDDHARYTSGNAALMAVVDGLQAYLDTHSQPMRVIAPGIKRLPFFFPLEDINIGDVPTNLKDLENVTYFIYGTPETGGDSSTLTPGRNPVLDVLSLASDDATDPKSVLRRAWWKDDGIFKYTVYELHLDKRWQNPDVTIPPKGEVVFGGFVRYLGYDILDHAWWQGRKIVANFFWQVVGKPGADYMIYIHLRDSQGNLLTAWDAPITRTADGNYYSSLVWEPGEYIIDRRILKLTTPDVPLGEDYQLVIGLYDRATQGRVPVTIDSQPAGDGFTLAESFSIIPEQK